jgi:hypothetical protein
MRLSSTSPTHHGLQLGELKAGRDGRNRDRRRALLRRPASETTWDRRSCRAVFDGLPTKQWRLRTGLTQRLRRSQRHHAVPEPSSLSVPLACHSQQSQAVPSGHPRTTPRRPRPAPSLSSQVTLLPDLALQAGGRFSRRCDRPCRARPADPVAGRGGPERRRRPRPDGTGTPARSVLGPQPTGEPRTTAGRSGHHTHAATAGRSTYGPLTSDAGDQRSGVRVSPPAAASLRLLAMSQWSARTGCHPAAELVAVAATPSEVRPQRLCPR